MPENHPLYFAVQVTSVDFWSYYNITCFMPYNVSYDIINNACVHRCRGSKAIPYFSYFDSS